MKPTHFWCAASAALALAAAVPISAHAATCHVDQGATGSNNGTNWANAYVDLQSALTNSSCTTVRVAKGTYKPTTTAKRDISFEIKPGVAVYGGYPTGGGTPDPAAHVTLLSGDIGAPGDASDNSHHVVQMDGSAGTPITASTVLDGFTIAHGRSAARGGGLYCLASGAGAECSPSLSRLVFSDNQVDSSGGGMASRASAGGVANPTLTDVVFRANLAHDGGSFSNTAEGGAASPALTRVRFEGSRTESGLSSGGAMENTAVGTDAVASPVLTDVVFDDNYTKGLGGALAFRASSGTNMQSRPVLTRVTFSGNSADDFGGAIYGTASLYGSGAGSVTLALTLSNVTFAGNHAGGGGAMSLSSDGDQVELDALLTHVTFSSNSATYGGVIHQGTIWDARNRLELANVILWDDAAPNGAEIYQSVYPSNPGVLELSINHSIVEGGASSIVRSDGAADTAFASGTGNLDADPRLGALADNGGFTQTLLPGSGSAAIDAGKTISDLATDQRGVHRPQGAAYDIGAVEVIDTAAVHTVTPVAGAGGSITPSTPQAVNGGASTAFTIAADAAHVIDNVTGCGGTLAGDTYTTGVISADCTVTASFKAQGTPSSVVTPVPTLGECALVLLAGLLGMFGVRSVRARA